MKHTHTPAPWHARATATINDHPAAWEIRDRFGVIAATNSVNPADARLIAAAPLLLEALHAALDDIDAQRSSGIEPPDWYQTARNAIATAKE